MHCFFHKPTKMCLAMHACIYTRLISIYIATKLTPLLQTPITTLTMDIETLMNHSNIKDFVVKEGRGVKGLAELGLKKLPQQYIQPLEKRFTSIEEENEDSIPVNDMSNWDEPKEAKAVCDAARKWGFFQIVNHGVPIHVLEDVKNATHKFFGLPPEEKIKHSRTRLDTNTVHVGSSFSPETEKALEWKDFLSFFFVSSNVDEAASIWPPVCR